MRRRPERSAKSPPIRGARSAGPAGGCDAMPTATAIANGLPTYTDNLAYYLGITDLRVVAVVHRDAG